MKITRENYEVYFIDYIDGNLAANMVSELHDFLTNNPDLKEELDSLQADTLYVQEEIFDFKNELKKTELPITHEELSLLLAKEAEGELTSEEISFLNNLSKNFPAISRMRKYFENTKIAAEHIAFDSKHLIRFDNEINLNDTSTLLVASLEGDLNEVQEKALSEKLSSNENLNKEKEFLSKAFLSSEPAPIDFKSNLLIPYELDMTLPENLLVAKVEGDLTLKQNEILAGLLSKDEALKKQLHVLYKTKIAPSKEVFEFKDSLRKKEVAVIPLRKIFLSITSAAAIVIFMVWFGLNAPTVPSELATVSERNATINNSKNPSPASSQEGVLIDASVESNNKNSLAGYKRSQQKRTPITPFDLKNEVAIIDSNFKRMTAPSLMEMRMPLDIAMHTKQGLKPTDVDMMLIHTPNNKDVSVAINNAANNTSAPATIWQLLGDAAEKRIEKTAAYALVERQSEKLKPQKNKFNFERTNDELKLRVGNFEFKKEMSTKKVKEAPNLFQRIAEKIERLR